MGLVTFSFFKLRSSAAVIRRLPYLFLQVSTLVNLPPKWTKDRILDHAVSREKHLRQILELITTLVSSDSSSPPLQPYTGYLARIHPSLFYSSSSSSRPTLSPLALRLYDEEQHILRESLPDTIVRLRKLLMLSTATRSLPLHVIDQLRFDLGLPTDYKITILPHYPQFFRIHRVPDDERVWLGLVNWEDSLAVPELRRDNPENLEFPNRFTRGFGMKRRWLEWLSEWQKLPYISPYEYTPDIDPRTDISEKRNVGVFHELLHLMIGKKTERKNVSNLRKAFQLPQKFTKVFERHPGIFYISRKLDTHTVVLREAYGGGKELLRKHPLIEIRDKYIAVLRTGTMENDNSDCSDEAEEIGFRY